MLFPGTPAGAPPGAPGVLVHSAPDVEAVCAVFRSTPRALLAEAGEWLRQESARGQEGQRGDSHPAPDRHRLQSAPIQRDC